MILFVFQPHQFKNAAAKLIEVHPFTVQELSRPAFIQKKFPNLVGGLRSRFAATPEDALLTFAQNLSPIERPLIKNLHLDPEEMLRLKILRLLYVDRELANADALLHAFTRYANTSQEGILIANTVLEYFFEQDAILTEWRLLLQQRVNSTVDTFNIQAILALSQRNITLHALFERIRIAPDSNLGVGLEHGILDAGPIAWAVQGREVTFHAFSRAKLHRRLNAILSAYNERAGQWDIQKAATFLVQDILPLLEVDQSLVQQLRDDHPNVWSWIQELRLKVFFDLDIGEGNERFEFWRRYLNKVQELHINTAEGRLFMTFTQVVIIEFIQTGNATYVYSKKEGENLINLDISQPSRKHQSFKKTDVAIKRWIHKPGWQLNFKYELSRININ